MYVTSDDNNQYKKEMIYFILEILEMWVWIILYKKNYVYNIIYIYIYIYVHLYL